MHEQKRSGEMIGYVMVGTNDLNRATRFYNATLAPLGLVQV